jgi:hypothetical protein
MKSIKKVKNDGDNDETHEEAYCGCIHSVVSAAVQACSMTTAWTWSQTFSRLSITCSR